MIFQCKVYITTQEQQDHEVFDEVLKEDQIFHDGIVVDNNETPIVIAKYNASENNLYAIHRAVVSDQGYAPFPKWEGIKGDETKNLKTHRKDNNKIAVDQYDAIVYRPDEGTFTKFVFTKHVEQVKVKVEKPVVWVIDSDDEEPVNEKVKHPNMLVAEKKAEAARKAVEAEAARKALEEEANAQALLEAAEEAKKRELEEQAAAAAAAKLIEMEKDKKIVDAAVNEFMLEYTEICNLQEQMETLKKQYIQKAFEKIDSLPKSVIPDPKDVAVKVGKNKNVNSFDVFKSNPDNAKLYKKLYRQGALLNRVEGKSPRNLHDDVRRAFNAYANTNPTDKQKFDEDLAKFLKEAKKPKEKLPTEEKPRKRKFVSRMADKIEKKLKML